jgi:predicted DNA-binding transcriptional regulator YafY
VVAAASEITDPDDRLRHWKLDRFQKAALTDDYFAVDPDVDLETHLGKSIGIFSGEQTEEVRIRLGRRAAGWVREDPWHPDQTLEPEDEDQQHWLLSVPAAHPRELLPKVLALGGEAEVLEPASFRDAVAEVVTELAQAYGVATAGT